jgi:aminoglycoside N3'-acetyltransferase
VSVDGSVLLLGVGMERCTLIHHFEEQVAPDLYLQPADRRERYTCRDRFGRDIVMHTRRHLRLDRNFPKFLDALDRRGQVRRHTLDGVPIVCFRARDMAEMALPWFERQPDASLSHADRPLDAAKQLP